jgi:plasmid stabilization system protein ParE
MKSSQVKTDNEIDSRIDSIQSWITHLMSVEADEELIKKWSDKLEILVKAKAIINDKGNGW